MYPNVAFVESKSCFCPERAHKLGLTDVTQKPLSSVLVQRVFTYFHYYPLVITHGLLEDLKIPDLYR